MEWIEAVSIIGSLGGFTFWIFTNLKNDIQALSSRVDHTNDRLDGFVREFNQRLDQTNQRLDGLYNIIIDMLKKGEKPS